MTSEYCVLPYWDFCLIGVNFHPVMGTFKKYYFGGLCFGFFLPVSETALSEAFLSVPDVQHPGRIISDVTGVRSRCLSTSEANLNIEIRGKSQY